MADSNLSLPERLLVHDRVVILAAVIAIILLTGTYTVFGVGMDMSALDMTRLAQTPGAPMQMANAVEWTFSFWALIFLMWWAMMIAMMTPSAAPTLLLFAAVKRNGSPTKDGSTAVTKFLVGYLLAWAVFSVSAASAQWALQMGGFISAQMMTITSNPLAGVVLISAGVYQFSGLKNACLKHCRSPARFLADHRRPGAFGPLIMGAHHGSFCLGCCWALMALLFVGGIMNLYWIVGLALYVLVEKSFPFGHLISRTAGIGLIVFGLYLLLPAARLLA